MFGYLTWHPSGRPRVTLQPAEIGGVIFLALEVQGNGRRLRRRVNRAVADMERCGVRRCVMPSDWPTEWRGGLRPVEEQNLRQKVFPRLLERLCRERHLDLSGATTMLSAPFVGQRVWEAADLLARRSRYLILSVEGGEELRRQLWRRYGISAVAAGRPALQVCFDEPVEPVPALLLGPDCSRRQTVTYELPARLRETLEGREMTSQLVTALWESGALAAEEIRVRSLGFGA